MGWIYTSRRLIYADFSKKQASTKINLAKINILNLGAKESTCIHLRFFSLLSVFKEIKTHHILTSLIKWPWCFDISGGTTIIFRSNFMLIFLCNKYSLIAFDALFFCRLVLSITCRNAEFVKTEINRKRVAKKYSYDIKNRYYFSELIFLVGYEISFDIFDMHR